MVPYIPFIFDTRCLILVFCTFLFVCRSYGESIAITDPEILKKIEGDWYLQMRSQDTPIYYVESDPIPLRVSLRVKDSLIILKSYILKDYDPDFSNRIDSVVYLIKSIDSKSLSAQLISQGIWEFLSLAIDWEKQKMEWDGFEIPRYDLDRNPKRYQQFLMSGYDWKERNCSLNGEYTLTCPNGSAGLHVFSIRNDTLIHFDMDKVRQAYLYDTLHKDFMRQDNEEQRLNMINDSTVALLQPNDTLYLEKMLTADLAQSTSFWSSNWRSKAYMNFSDNYVTTNINDTITLWPNFEEPVALFKTHYRAHQYIDDGHLVETVFFYTNNSEKLQDSHGYPFLKSNYILYKLWREGYELIDIATREIFSFVEGIEARQAYGSNMLKSNPVGEVAEILNCPQFEYKIYNTQGVLQRSGETKTGKVSLEGLPSNTYFLRLHSPTHAGVMKLVKE